ncbi:conserved protein of unknown function [Vibrio tapetis subsp. tapetis]|uniref:GIY-YIG domain-containing protein n=1 Tax=Vibrio tapetis subsp. tapetis TaxID=1671868 RepID=A0A2N8ZGG8_9VIBR|nr:GIY-YIG nuclease family protein [Vibrio tapetis]SON51019.1 conserved protein of unknown function [Vibrio tapetis subsp. tapetis]
MQKQPCVYFLSSVNKNALYIGVTSNLKKRVWLHKSNAVNGFSKRYQTHELIYFELYSTMDLAIAREKQVKKWRRQWKNELVDTHNPEWLDLYLSL